MKLAHGKGASSEKQDVMQQSEQQQTAFISSSKSDASFEVPFSGCSVLPLGKHKACTNEQHRYCQRMAQKLYCFAIARARHDALSIFACHEISVTEHWLLATEQGILELCLCMQQLCLSFCTEIWSFVCSC